MKRYLVFGYDTYYPCGAEGDQIADCDSLEDAVAAIKNDHSDYHSILDMQERCWLVQNPETGAWENGDR